LKPDSIVKIPATSGRFHVCYLPALLLAVVVYFYGLDGLHIPKNGDEFPYLNITRLTAESGKLLPLQSNLHHMRNTKPPLLFWQGIVSTKWGSSWTLWNLRYPSVIYTLMTAFLVMLLARKISGSIESGFIAALAFLAFFSTYRYGRPFLTDPPQVFWIFLPFFTLLYWRKTVFESRFIIPLLLGCQVGVGLLYKSFALAVPVYFAISWWYLHHLDYRWRTFLAGDIIKIFGSCLLSLLIFGLWFVMDPDPGGIWREFVIGENIGKFDPHGNSYLRVMLWGPSSLWRLALDFLSNAGLLIFPVTALIFIAIRDRRQQGSDQRLLWIWVISLFIVFSLASQRDGRYLMPAMPALAILLAISWQRIGRGWFVASLLVSIILISVGGYLSIRLQQQLIGQSLYPWHFWLLMALTAVLVIAGLIIPPATRYLTVIAALLVMFQFAAVVRPLDGLIGNYPAAALKEAKGREVWVPCNFRAGDEGYRFIVSDASIHGYRSSLNLNTPQLAERYPLFAVKIPITGNDYGAGLTADCSGCRVLGSRLEMRGRHNGRELQEMIFGGKLFQHLFVREMLIESTAAPKDAAHLWIADDCR